MESYKNLPDVMRAHRILIIASDSVKQKQYLRLFLREATPKAPALVATS